MTIRKLRQGEQDDLRDHLLRLAPEDRQMRFMGGASDSSIQSYCDRIRLAEDNDPRVLQGRRPSRRR